MNENSLTLRASEALDTSTAPQLEAVLESDAKSVKEPILDFEHPEYISSAGLRVLLQAKKSMEA